MYQQARRIRRRRLYIRWPHRDSAPAASGIEIELNGARVRVTGMVDPVQLRLVLRCLMPA